MKRREFITLLSGAAAMWPLAVRAQQSGKVYRIGFLANDPTIPTTAAGQAFTAGLRENGFVEGQNIIIERRFMEGGVERSHEFAAELVRMNVDVIVTSGVQSHPAAKQATTTVPIVMVNATDPVAEGLVASLARPGGNITGLVQVVSADLAGKRLQLFKDAVPQISRVAILMNPDLTTDQSQWNLLERAAESMGIAVQAVSARQGSELAEALEMIIRQRADALFGMNDGLNLTYRKSIAEFAAEHRLPSMSAFAEAAWDGGLMAYATNRPDLFRRAAAYVAKILRGAKPADLPIEQPIKFELVVNLKTARLLGLTIPRDFLLLADEVIE
jgi:putative tryptophan/tyrosine transport system substrate-binding protein